MIRKIKIILSCDEASLVCDKAQYNNASLWEKIFHNIHLMICKACRIYSENNTKLSKLISKSKVVCLDKNCKEKMKKEFDVALKESST